MPTRKRKHGRFAASPTPAQIRAARLATGLTQTAASTLVCVSPRTWQQWEQGRSEMPRGLFELLLLKQGEAPGPRPSPKGAMNGRSPL